MMTNQRHYLMVAAAVALTTACTVGPKYVQPATPNPPAFKEPPPESFGEAKGWKVGEPRDNLIRGKWWEIFGDTELNALEEQIEPQNQSLAMAEAQYRGARAAIRVARSAYYPTLTGGSSITGTGTSGNLAAARGTVSNFATLVVP